MEEMGPLARAVYAQKYCKDGVEDWSDTAKLVATNVMGALGYPPNDSLVLAVSATEMKPLDTACEPSP